MRLGAGGVSGSDRPRPVEPYGEPKMQLGGLIPWQRVIPREGVQQILRFFWASNMSS